MATVAAAAPAVTAAAPPVPVQGLPAGGPADLNAVAAAAAAAAAAGMPQPVVMQQQPVSGMLPVQTNASLYVGDLDADVVETDLFNLFQAIGGVSGVRIPRDRNTRRSLGYAYVNFMTPEDAGRALDLLNFAQIRSRPCRIMWSERDPARRRTGKGNIFIKNLDPEIDSKSLYDTFSMFGNILSCKVVENGHYGYVQFEKEDAATRAIEKVNGMKMGNSVVSVKEFVPSKERTTAQSKFTNVFVKNIPNTVSEQDFRTLCSKYGDITSVLMRDPPGTFETRFAFVNFRTHEQAVAAIDALNDVELESKKLIACRHVRKVERERDIQRNREAKRQEMAQRSQGVNIYVRNFDETMNDDKLRALFAEFGEITSARVMLDDKGASRLFGFVCFKKPDEALRAIGERNKSILNGKPLYVVMAQPLSARRAFLEQYWASRMRGMPFPGPMFPFPGQPGIRPPNMMPMMRPGQRMPNMPDFASFPPRPFGFPPNAGAFPGPQGFVNQAAPGAAGRNVRPAGQGGPRMRNQQGLPPNAVPGMLNATARPPMGMARPAFRSNQPQMPPMPMMGRPQRPDFMQVLATMAPEQQRQMIGSQMYSLVQPSYPEAGGKITGMIVESLDIPELLSLLESSDALNAKIEEAMSLLKSQPAAE
jgi:polyadenylate-binding protein